MRRYIAGGACRMEFLRRELDDPCAEPCGRCDVCAGPWYPTDGLRGRRGDGPVVDRPAGRRARGRARCGRPAWTRSASPSRAASPPTSGPSPAGRWPGCRTSAGAPGCASCSARASPTPRRRHASSAPSSTCSRAGAGSGARSPSWPCRRGRARGSSRSVAERIAEIGQLPLLGSLADVDGGPTGARGGNSAHRLAAVWDRFAVRRDVADQLRSLDGPVLLVDDVADTRWTLTVAARALRHAGAAAVLPFALALDA